MRGLLTVDKEADYEKWQDSMASLIPKPSAPSTAAPNEATQPAPQGETATAPSETHEVSQPAAGGGMTEEPARQPATPETKKPQPPANRAGAASSGHDLGRKAATHFFAFYRALRAASAIRQRRRWRVNLAADFPCISQPPAFAPRVLKKRRKPATSVSQPSTFNSQLLSQLPERSASQYWLSRFAWLCVAFTLALIFVGGMVTSKQAGLAVPDWPLSYGSLNPKGWWQIENVRLEHGHRLIASTLGILIIALAIWVARTQDRRWVRWLAYAALAGVIFQGVLGGLRVTERSVVLALLHGCVAQAFLAALVVLAVACTPRWFASDRPAPLVPPAVRVASTLTVGIIYGQLIVGAVMRHFKAGLAIPDFPTSFGGVIPPLNTFPVIINFTHRVGALIVACVVLALLFLVLKNAAGDGRLLRPALLLAGLVALQIMLGASVIWLAKAPVPTTLHVVNGALILATAVSFRTKIGLWRTGDAALENPGAALHPAGKGAR